MCMEIVKNPSKPIQYILGNECFYGNLIECCPPILIPRPETEQLIDIIKLDLKERLVKQTLMRSKSSGSEDKIEDKSGNKNQYGLPLHVLDIGSGSGIIGLSLLQPSPYEMNDASSEYYSNLFVTAIDINKEAVDLSIRNANRILAFSSSHSNAKHYQCIHTSFKDYADKYNSDSDSDSQQLYPLYDVIVSNPPYISTKDYFELDPSVLEYEDRGALDGGDDNGLVIIKEIIKNCSKMYKPSVKTKKLYLEIGLEQISILKDWCISKDGQLYCSKNSDSDDSIISFLDFTDRERFVCIYLK